MNRRRKLKIDIPNVNLTKLGTNYGGWFVPSNMVLNKDSIIYSGGVGEDISFDLLLSHKYDSNILLIDPTKRSSKHYQEIKEYYKNKNTEIFSGDIQKDYHDSIKDLNINFNKINYSEKGLWDKKESLKFYKPTNEKYVSHSLIEGMTSREYDIVEVNSIKNIMESNNHKKIDLLKLDIEGAEIKVLKQMLDDHIFPTYLLVEFDLFLQKKDKDNETKKIINRLNTYYDILKNDNYNITFIKK